MSLTDNLKTLLRIVFPTLDNKCTHSKVRPDVEQAYCPDCGKLIENRWYITRCSSCGVKMKAMVKNGQIVPQYHYCSNCGGESFTVERVEKINFVDINFAVLVKSEAEHSANIHHSTTCWQERTIEIPRLPVLYP